MIGWFCHKTCCHKTVPGTCPAIITSNGIFSKAEKGFNFTSCIWLFLKHNSYHSSCFSSSFSCCGNPCYLQWLSQIVGLHLLYIMPFFPSIHLFKYPSPSTCLSLQTFLLFYYCFLLLFCHSWSFMIFSATVTGPEAC